ncbi:MAG TPA: TonB-dependent receptor [Lacunisphaera sp.]
MKFRFTLSLFRGAVLGAALALLPHTLPAQSAAGAVAGRVTDANTRSALPGVEVRAGAVVTTSARDGSFRLAGVPAGEQVVAFSYLGYESVSRTVAVEAGQAVDLEVALGSEVLQLPAFRIEGAREGQARALNQQKASPNLKNIVSADAMGNFPDKNVAESLQRIPGIHTEGQRGEPRFITIRGAAPGLNSVTLDGMSILGTEQDFRTVSLDVFPSAQLAGIEVVKAITPDMDADSIGGAVVLKGKSAFDAGRRVLTANVNSTYSEMADDLGYRGAVSYGDIFGRHKDWGIQVSYSHERVNGLEQNVETNNWTPTTVTVNGTPASGFLPATLLLTNVTVEKTRESVSGAIEKKIGDDLRVYVRGFANTFNEFNLRDGLRYALGVTAAGGNLDTTKPVVVSPDGTFQQYTATRATARRQIQPRSINDTSGGVITGLTVQKPDWTLDLAAAYNRADSDLNTVQGQWVSKSNLNSATVNQTDPHFWQLTQNSGAAFFDASALGFNQLLIRNDYLFNDETMVKADATRTFRLAGEPLKLAVGGKQRWNTKSRNNTPVRYDSVFTGTLDFNDPRLGGNITIDPAYLRGRYDFGPSVDAAKMQEFFLANDGAGYDAVVDAFPADTGLFRPNLGNTYNNSLVNDYKIKEDIGAGYVRADWQHGPWGFILGARFEQTDLRFNATQVNANRPNTDRSRYTPYLSTSSYDNFLPAFHARYDVSKRLVLRGAWTNTLARPAAPDMLPAFSVNTVDRIITGGNPALRPVESQNLDLSAEYYLSSVGVISVGVFSKRLDGPIYGSTTTLPFDDGTGVQSYRYVTKLNAGSARLDGFEFSYQQQLRFLPAPFDGLGLYANLTLVDSNVDIPERPGEEFSLFKQAKSVGNVAVFYQKNGWNARLSYTFRDKYLSELAGQGIDVYFDDDSRLDLQVGYKLRGGLTVQFSANNLQNSPELQYHGSASRALFYADTGRFYSVGLAWEL